MISPVFQLKHRLVLVVFLASMGCLQGQTVLLRNFDCTAPGAAMVVAFEPDCQSQGAPAGPEAVYFDGVEEMRRIKEALVVDAPRTVYPFFCNDDWTLMACIKDSLQLRLTASTRGKSISGPDGDFTYLGYFPFDGYKIAVRRKELFKDVGEARAQLAVYRADPKFLAAEPPEWKVWDGEFEFQHWNRIKEQAVAIDSMRQVIAKAYPGEPFAIEASLFHSNAVGEYGYRFVVQSRASLHSRFDLLTVVGPWNGYAAELVSYWRK